MSGKIIFFILVLIVVGGLVWYGTSQEVTVIDADTTIDGDFVVENGEKIVIKDSAVVTVLGDLNIKDGEVTCEGGAVTLIVGGDATIGDTLSCERGDTEEGDTGNGILLVVEGMLVVDGDAEVESDGNIQIVEKISLLARTPEEINALYEEAALDSGAGQRIGPFVDSVGGGVSEGVVDEYLSSERAAPTAFIGVQKAEATSHTVVVGGKVRVKTPQKGVKRIVLLSFPTAVGVKVKNLDLRGPDGRDGASDKGAGCNAKGEDGENAFRFLAQAPNIEIDNFTLTLGSGGAGGDAETTKDCDPGSATGGAGGKAGNFKMIAGNQFTITGKFTVNPGKGGEGGAAVAHGKDGGPTEDGGDAKAEGGGGADNKKQLRIAGTVAGTSNVEVGSVIGGDGGPATANPGDGGDGNACGVDGGEGGAGEAEGGAGGDASLTLAGSAVRVPGAEDTGGAGGDASAHGGAGGNGGTCDPSGPGGDGGRGGDVEKAKAGDPGTGTDGAGNPGNVGDETGGDGGDGGDGCPEGKLGKGGKGNPDGKDGVDGKNICQEEEKPRESAVQPSEGQVIDEEVTTPPLEDSAGTIETEIVALDLVSVEPIQLRKRHVIGESNCPDPLGGIVIDGPAGANWQLVLESVPNWLSIRETKGVVPAEIPVDFNCQITDFTSHEERAHVQLQVFDGTGQQADSFFDVFVDVVAE